MQEEPIQPTVDAAPSNVLTHEELAEAVEVYKKKSIIHFLFPILPQEKKRFWMMVIMFGLISFTYTFLRVFKDRVVNSVLDNVESKNWLKLLTFVATQIFVIICQNISSRTSFNQAYTQLVTIFIVLLTANALLMYFSNRTQLNDLFADSLFVSNKLAVRGLNIAFPFIQILNQIWYSIFYILAEVIGSMMVSFCFMTYVNTNTSEGQNRRFVKGLYFFSNLTSCLAGYLTSKWSEYCNAKPKEYVDKYFLIFPLTVAGIYGVILFIKKILEVEFQNKIVVSSTVTKKSGSKKAKIGFKDSIYLMFNSKLLLCMSSLALFYNISSNMFDNSNAAGIAATASYLGLDRSYYATKFKTADTIYNGLITAAIILSPLSLIIDTQGIFWFSMAPLVIVFISTIVTFVLTLFNLPLTGTELMPPFNTLFNSGKRYPELESVAGTIIQILMKVSKYAFYDIVKEAVSMKIEPELRPLFKGVFDGSMSKFGKCVGSIYGIIMGGIIFDGYENRYYFPITACILFSFCFGWVFAIKYLNRAYNEAKSSGTFINPDMEEKIKQ